ncbi:MAG: redox-sensing transcriptional repressor Rex [Candidatus Omnitrophota bacterium]
MLKANKKSIARLYRYRNALYRLRYMGLHKFFSDNLADAVGVTASQVRKDLAIFGPLGNKRGGYLVDDLINKLNEILGKDKPQNIIIVGYGNIGMALKHYKGFEREGINIVAVFDNDPSKINREDSVPVLPLEELKDFVEKNKITVGVMAVPDVAAQQVVDIMCSGGIKGILNFAPIRLDIPEGFVINNVNVGVELETVIYFVNALEKSDNQDERTES